jgi:hypothetical protein
VSTQKRISGSSQKIKINRSTVKALPLFKPDPEKPNTNQQLLFDSVLPGFGVRITESNKAYFAQKRVGRKVVRFTIGPCNQIIPEKAREIANEKLLEMTRGQDPNLIKQGILAEAEITLEKSFQDFVEVISASANIPCLMRFGSCPLVISRSFSFAISLAFSGMM